MVAYMQLIAAKGDELAREKFQSIFEELDLKMQNPVLDLQYDGHQPNQYEIDNHVEKLSSLKDTMSDYCAQMICLGFNSSKYDIEISPTSEFGHRQCIYGEEKQPVRLYKHDNTQISRHHGVSGSRGQLC